VEPGRTLECLAGDAVLVAPVSDVNSLPTGNFTGNARDSRNLRANFAAFARRVAKAALADAQFAHEVLLRVQHTARCPLV